MVKSSAIPGVAAAIGLLALLFAIPAAAYGTSDARATVSNPDTGSADTGVQRLFLYMDDEDLEELYTRDPLSDELLNGTVRLAPDGEELGLEGVRFRGTSSRFLPKRSFAIRFAEPQPFLFGSNRMELKATYTDPTMMKEKIALDLFREIGQPASRTTYFDLYINDIYEGLYIHVERVDAHLLASNGLNPNGTLVADNFRGNQGLPEVNRLSVFGYPIDETDDPEAFLEETMDSRGEPNWSAFGDLVSWVHRTPAGPEFEAGFNERFDADNFIDWLAIHFLIGDIDSFADDYWLYRDTDDPDAKWIAIPWDKDLTFGSYTRLDSTANDYFAYEYALESGWDNELVARFLATPALRGRLNDRMAVLMEDAFPPEYYSVQVRELEGVVGPRLNITPGEDAFVLHPQNHHGEPGRLPYHTEAILDFVHLRYQFIERNITPIPGEPYTASANITCDREGRSVYFTDSDGWVIASLDAREVVNPGNVTVEVRELPFNPGINRSWQFNAGDARVNGSLTLYYRNDVPGFEHAGGNWFASIAPVRDDRSSQWNLTMAAVGEDGNLTELETYVNPYSNKASANVSLRGEQEYMLMLDTTPRNLDNITANATGYAESSAA